MAEVKNTFIKGSMNKDLDERLVPNGQYIDALNIDVEATEGQDSGAAKNKLGNTLVSDLAIVSGRNITTARTIGAIEYEATNKIYWFVACDTFDGIYEYDETTGTTTRVLQSNKSLPSTISKLNFKKDYLITGVNYIRAQEDESYLYWTDDLNPPRRINIARAKSYAVDDAKIDKDINVIIEPPLFAPSIDTYFDNTINDSNNMSEKFLYFSYRYKYVDNQYSAISPFSAVAFLPKQYEYDYGVGNNASMTNIFNSVRISVETGNEFVKEIQILVKDTRNINVSIIDSYSKENLLIPNDSSYTVTFNNNKIYAALPNDQVTRLYDNVPLLAKAQDVVGNRLAYGNYVQFRDIVDCNNKSIPIDYRLDLIPNAATESNPRPTWRSDRDYEIGIVYLDAFGRMTTILNGVNPNYNSIYIPAANSASANAIKLTIKNNPPCWATHYRVYVKQAKKSYYNVFPIILYSDGLFKYFLINQSDLNKIKVGEYIIFKATSAGPTYSNKKYKILEIEQKAAGFIPNAIAGLYFKIKVDNPNELSGVGVEIYKSQGIGGSNVSATFATKKVISPLYGFTQNYFSQGVTLGWVEKPIFYGNGNANGISLPNTPNVPFAGYRATEDARFTIQIDGPKTYSIYKNSITIYSPKNNNTLLLSNQPILKNIPTSILNQFTIIFNQSTYNVGDKWVFNCRKAFSIGSDSWIELGGIAPYDLTQNVAIVPDASWGQTDKKILTGAIIEIYIAEDTFNPNGKVQTCLVSSPSPADYENIEEWWYESGARDKFNYIDVNGNNIFGARVRFRRGINYNLADGSNTDFKTNRIEVEGSNLTGSNYPVRMLIFSSVPTNPGSNGSFAAKLYDDKNIFTLDLNQSKFVVDFKITQQKNLNICETVPVEEDADIYHELLKTYPIEGGKHKVEWRYSDFEFNGGDTQLRQFDKAIPHYFNVGDSVFVTTTTVGVSGTWTVTKVVDLYTIVINAPFPGPGPVTPGKVILASSVDQDQTVSQPAIIQINNPFVDNTDFNAWCWGNGLESDRIYDDFNETRKGFSPRVQVPIEDYKQIRSEASICYSGVFQNNSSLNRLNEFNLSLANFKYLDRDFGSIQKLYARDTDLVVFQENKVSTVLYGKNVLFDSIGGGQVVSIPEVLGTQIPMNGEWGISKNPESFAKWAESVYFTDQRRGVVLQMASNQLLEISSLGMTDYFRDLMKTNPNTQKLGAYDPHNNMYVLSSNDRSSIPCRLTLSPETGVISSPANTSLLFTIISDVSWTITLIDMGSGTSWMTNYKSSGNGSQDIYGTYTENTGLTNRLIRFSVEYCNGLTKTFTLTQGRSPIGTIGVLVISDDSAELGVIGG